jgi:hypothetical protein
MATITVARVEIPGAETIKFSEDSIFLEGQTIRMVSAGGVLNGVYVLPEGSTALFYQETIDE